MKLIFQILLILLIIATVSICAIQPDMHKNVIVYDSDYTLVPEQEVKTETKEIPIVEAPIQPINKTTAIEKKVQPSISTASVEKKVQPKTTTTSAKTQSTQKQVLTKPKTVTAQTQTVTQQRPKITATQTISTPKIETQTAKKETLPVVKKEEKVVVKQPEPVHTMTQQEETIAWNIWRSNLTNKIMSDTKLPNIPNGVLFQFSFSVDKYGKISNVQTGANPANYTPYAIQYIAPVIRSYQGRSILNFPEGTARTSTQVTGKWRISDTQKYSTPQDYNDLEKIQKYQ